MPHFTTEALDAAVNEFLVEKQVGMGAVMTVLRLAVIGSGMGPHLTEVIALIGPDEFSRRIKNAVTTLQ